ncbi:MAG: hypothetical protein A3D52_02430 [Candidatus Taylorbacteria bacterium RIFCSPHIGHO2_02_FULL_44_36]|nr:MAG: hypothetical protein A3D52_02430 [Candidatus Taylorbacteria bacterium RIFCSPHIGHO2_02_FULL_44_36]
MIAMLKNLKSFISESFKSASKTQKVMLMIAGGFLLITASLILIKSWGDLISRVGNERLTAQVASSPSSGCLAPYVDLGYLTLDGLDTTNLTVGRYYQFRDWRYIASSRHLPSLLNTIYLSAPGPIYSYDPDDEFHWYPIVTYPCPTTDYVNIANSIAFLTINGIPLSLGNLGCPFGGSSACRRGLYDPNSSSPVDNNLANYIANYWNEPGWSDVFAETPLSWMGDYLAGTDPFPANPFLTFNLLQSALASAYPNAQSRVNAEDALINSIAVSGKITIDFKTATTPQTVVKSLDIPMSNCALISGTGPRKVVFTRNGRWNSNVNVFLLLINNVIENGFKRISPFKEYINQFSFYVDLRKIVNPEGVIQPLPSESSCFSVAPDGKYLHYTFINGLTPYTNLDGTVFNLKPVSLGCSYYYGCPPVKNTFDYYVESPTVDMHEFGHLFGKLFDEYLKSSVGSLWNLAQALNKSFIKNCTTFPQNDYRNTDDNKIYGSVTSRGCSYMFVDGARSPRDVDPRYYYRPSIQSIMANAMDNPSNLNKFNIIDCGYIVAAIKGEPPTKMNAQYYWSECKAMDVVKNNLPPVSPTPAMTVPVTDAWISGSSVSLSGSGFTKTNNAVQFVNTATGNVYETVGIPSNGSTLSFLVPTDAPSGNYIMKVGAFNSDWSNSITVRLKAPPVRKAPPAKAN